MVNNLLFIGHIVTHEWADSCYMLHLNPLLEIIPEKDLIEEHAHLRKKWREDMQLLSDYLDFKVRVHLLPQFFS